MSVRENDTTSVARVLDRIAIVELTARYNRAADGTDPDELLSLFTPDGEIEVRGGTDGAKTYAATEIASLVAPFPAQRVHMTLDATIEINGDTATQLCTLLLCTRSRRRHVAALFTGRYADDLVRTAGGWRFRRRVIEVDYSNEARMTLPGGGS